MKAANLTGLNRRRLKLWLVLFFMALLIPSAILIYQAFSQLKWETFHRHRVQAEELTARIDTQLNALVQSEQQRSFNAYAFVLDSSSSNGNIIQRSPLSNYPVASAIPGVLGYFQVDSDGLLSSPLLPTARTTFTDYGISQTERAARQSLQRQIQQILSQNRLVTATSRSATMNRLPRPSQPAESDDQDLGSREKSLADATSILSYEIAEQRADSIMGSSAMAPATRTAQSPAQAAFDRLNSATDKRTKEESVRQRSTLGRVDELKLKKGYQAQLAQQAPALPQAFTGRKATASREAEVQPAPKRQIQRFAKKDQDDVVPAPPRIETFSNALDAFEFSLLDSGHLVLFRKVWRNDRRYIQGLLIEQQPFIAGLIDNTFQATALAQMSDLVVAYQDDVLQLISGNHRRDYLASSAALSGELLYQRHLSSPLGELALIFSVRQLPAGAGGTIVIWSGVILLLILCGGFLLMYRLAARQIALGQQQQDFISAVSHELKTPLTSIRMYGEMLREGWASEEKKKDYYNFIYDESERLTRLINNVLQLARMTRNRLTIDLHPMPIEQLITLINSKISSQLAQAGFEFQLQVEEGLGQQQIAVDPDSLSQILINLVDNAIKFSARSPQQRVELSLQQGSGNRLLIGIRDYGPGIEKDQLKKIFRLFYRSENELTRETVGTGIGLALVQQLATAMQAKVDVLNRKPGAEFRLEFSLVDPGTAADR